MTPQLEIRCLGRFSLACRAAPLSAADELPLPATVKSQSLLAYLVMNRRRSCTRDHLADLFWGDRPEHNARRSLATALWQIRRCLPGHDFILADAYAVQFDPHSPSWLDVAEFEQLLAAPQPQLSALQRAVTLYRGDFLDGVYDDWVLSERYRLESLYCDALAQLMVGREALDECEAALAVAHSLLARDPLREDAHRIAMRAYCRLGQRHAALAQFERCRQALETELGVAPMAETVVLRQAIVEGRIACVTGPRIARDAAATTAVEVPHRARAWHPFGALGQIPLVGRERELAFLAQSWQSALQGRCSLLLLSGETGVGKTRLAQEFADRQRWQGARVLQGRCYEFERLLPYQPVAEALKSMPPDGAVAAAATLPAWVSAELATLAPNLLSEHRDACALGSTGPGVGQERLFEAAATFLSQLARQELLLLVLEDLHWATDSTLQLLHYLARALINQPLLIVGTQRVEPTPAAHLLSTLGRRLEREGLARRLKLSRLTGEAVAELIDWMSGAGADAAPLAHRLYLETEGNPFYLIQMIKALFEQGALRIEKGAWQGDFAALSGGRLPLPPGVSETIAARVGRLDEASQDALRVAAVLGAEFDFEPLNQAWGKGEEACLAALDDLLRQQLIAEATAGADYAFTHHKIQEVVYDALPRHRRLYLHGQAGLAIERWLGADTASRAAELAVHFEYARQLDARLADKAIMYLLQAGRQAERQSANLEALGYYQRGLEILRTLPDVDRRLPQEIELQMALAVPTTVVYGYASLEARKVYERARDVCRQAGDTRAHCACLIGLSRNYGVAGDNATSLQLAEELLAAAGAAKDGPLLLEAYRSMGGPLLGLARLREAEAFWRRGLAAYDLAQHELSAYRFGHDPAVTLYSYLSLTLWLLGYPDQALEQSRCLRRLLGSFSHPTSLAYAHSMLALCACAQRDASVAGQDAAEAIRFGLAHGLPSWTAQATALRGWVLAEQGDLVRGMADLKEGIATYRRMGFANHAPFCLGLYAEVCLKAHTWAEAACALAAARAITQQGGDVFWVAELDRLQGELLWAQGQDKRGAEAYFDAAIATARQQEARLLELRASVSLARLLGSQGRREAAQQALAEVYGRFDEGFETVDLQAATGLLRELDP